VLGPRAAVVKPQSAFFEAYGARGIAALETVVGACREAGALVVLDVKRGDIGSTMAAYARAYLDPAAPLAVDAITTSPYLGIGSLQPAFELAEQTGAGVFVLAVTSNPEGAAVQAAIQNGRSVAQTVVDDLARRNADRDPLGSLGIVVGATVGAAPVELAALNGPVLVPGIGAQGGTAKDVRRIFGPVLRGVLPSVSREVLRAGPDPRALRAAVDRQLESFTFLRS
jgi:orotidine-5'-phosphate decarboxylase